jgi:homoserine O-acetyltransferase
MNYFHYPHTIALEGGESLPELTIAYSTYGTMNADKSNVVWVCHALTANSEAADWWGGIIGPGQVIDPEKHFIVCANILGSCYGSTGPLSINPITKAPYFSSFPLVTIRDMVKAHILLREHLGIEKIFLLMGGSMGGYQAMEWSIMENDRIGQVFLLATSATESAWGIAIHTAQRLAIEADQSWQSPSAEAGANGLKAARAIGMLTYRNYQIMVAQQTDPDSEKIDQFKASSYIQYQGGKLVQRFNAMSYWLLTKSMDSHHIGRGRGGNKALILKDIIQKTLLIGINSDILCPIAEQQFLNRHLPNANLVVIDSNYGHDGFMVETSIISQHLSNWLDK